MNWQQFRAFFWLRQRLRINQLKRSGFGNAILLAVLGLGIVMSDIGLFVVFFLVGQSALSEATPFNILYVCDVLVSAFLVLWLVGLLADLQRSEVLSLDKFLHLPVSLSGAFFVNYLSSLFSLSLLAFVPAMAGLSLGLAVDRTAAMLLLLPLLAAFLLMITAVTHQFQGWLASIMVNPRRRRTIIVLLTMGFVLLAQIPNLINALSHSRGPDARLQQLLDDNAQLHRAAEAGRITLEQYQQQTDALQRDYDAEVEAESRRNAERMKRSTRLANLLLPPGWLPLGAMTIAEGKLLPALLATLAMTLAGTASLWRSYRATLRLYTGQFSSGRRRAAVISSPRAEASPPAESGSLRAGQPAALPAAHLLEKKLPWLSEQAAVIALSNFRSLTRAPEAKMMVLSSVLMIVIAGTVVGRGIAGMPAEARPLLGFAAMAFILMGMVQLVGNQFGFDRSGFQVFVLCGASRRDILLGKNMSLAPLALALGLAAAVALQLIVPMRFDYFLAVPPQLVSMYLLFCLLANLLSILAPVRIPAGSLRGAKPGLLTIIVQLLFMFVLFPLTLLPALLPQVVGWLLDWQGWAAGVPVCALLSLAECAAVVCFYRLVLRWQGRLLQAAEQRILGVVRMKAE